MRAALLVAAVAAGCFDPTYPTGQMCAPDCPPGQVCNAAGICELPGAADAGPDPDAPPPDECEELTCTNAHGTNECVDGACVFTCEEGTAWENCNGDPTDGCDYNLDENYDCATQHDTTTLPEIAGDADSGINFGTIGEAFFKVHVRETDLGNLVPLTVRVTLQSEGDTDYDLYVTCDSCGGTLAGQSELGTDQLDVVEFGFTDVGPDALDELDIFVEVRWASSASCSYWELTVEGNGGATARPCD